MRGGRRGNAPKSPRHPSMGPGCWHRLLHPTPYGDACPRPSSPHFRSCPLTNHSQQIPPRARTGPLRASDCSSAPVGLPLVKSQPRAFRNRDFPLGFPTVRRGNTLCPGRRAGTHPKKGHSHTGASQYWYWCPWGYAGTSCHPSWDMGGGCHRVAQAGQRGEPRQRSPQPPVPQEHRASLQPRPPLLIAFASLPGSHLHI